MKYILPLITWGCLVGVLAAYLFAGEDKKRASAPYAWQKGKLSLEEVLAKRRSIRSFRATPLTRQQIMQLLWAGQGITQPGTGKRTSPSAGALYPLELYVCTAEGVEHYLPESATTRKVTDKDVRKSLQAAALGQPWVGQAPAVIAVTAVVSRTEKKYGRRAERYVYMEAGHAGQNILLQAVSLELGAVPVGAFYDNKVASVLALSSGEEPMYLIPVGIPAGRE